MSSGRFAFCWCLGYGLPSRLLLLPRRTLRDAERQKRPESKEMVRQTQEPEEEEQEEAEEEEAESEACEEDEALQYEEVDLTGREIRTLD